MALQVSTVSSERLRSIVPMFGGATSYVDTLDAMLEFVSTHQPTTDELLGWHRGRFDRVSSAESIRRRLTYLENVGFLENSDRVWRLGSEGRTYLDDQSTDTLVEIMCRRNVGLRSLLYTLAAGPITVEAVGRQQLDTHPELDWDPSNTDMTLQRVNWLRSLGLVEQNNATIELTEAGTEFVDRAVEQWAESSAMRAADDQRALTAGTYETTVHARTIDPEFRATALSRYDTTCPVSGVDHAGLLDVAHVLSWSEHPAHRADLTNVLPLSKTHHAAFDRQCFTIDSEYCLRVNPEFETNSELLQQTLHSQEGEVLPLPESALDTGYTDGHRS